MKTFVKKVASVLIAVCLAVGMIFVPVIVSAAAPVKLTLTSTNGAPGQDITVSLNISADSKLAAADFTIAFDGEKLLLKDYKEGPAAAGGFSSTNPNATDKDGLKAIKHSFISTDGASVAGSLLTITFTVAPGWTGTTPLTLTIADFYDNTYNKLAYEIENGIVTAGTASGTIDTTAVPVKEKSTSSQKGLIILLVAGGALAVVAVAVVVALVTIKKRQKNTK